MGSQRGRLTLFSDRQHYIELIDEAAKLGARKEKACAEIGLSIRTLQRWQQDGQIVEDKRPKAKRPEPSNKLTPAECQAVLDICNTQRFEHLPPSQIVPILADEGTYIASESSFYRILKANNQLTHRGKDKPKGKVSKPTTYQAEKPNQVWSWDITYCPSRVKGLFYYLYMIIDIYSRKIVGWEVHETESGEHAADLLQRAVWSEKCRDSQVVLHSDNGSPMKSMTMLAKMQDLGIMGSRSRPSVSNDNPYSESLFRTLKYNRRWPSEGFNSLEEVRQWCQNFVDWYNTEHRHSKIKFVTPEQRHLGKDASILKKRDGLFKKAKLKHPCRWSQSTRNWDMVGSVALNPTSQKEVA